MKISLEPGTGCKIYSVMADAVIEVELDKRGKPILPDGWRWNDAFAVLPGDSLKVK